MKILSRIIAIALLFFVLIVGVQMYPMDPDAVSISLNGSELTANYRDGRKSKKIGHLKYEFLSDGTVHLSSLRVDEAFRKHKVGRRLMEDFLSELRARSVPEVSLEVAPEGESRQIKAANHKRLVRFYSSFGFIIDQYPDGMRLELLK